MNLFDFSGKNILITGASSGIGKAVAKYFSSCGANLVLVARKTDKLGQLSSELPGISKIFPYDLTNLEDIYQIFDFCKDQNMVLNGLVHCAGVCPLMPVQENDINLMLETFKINYFSFIELVKYFSDPKFSLENSSIVAISSDAAKLGGFRQSIYSGTKAALNSSVKSMARELQYPRKIRINTIMPSAVETEMLQTLRNQSQSLDEKILARQPLGIIQSDNIAGLAGYLMSDMGKFMTGLSIPVNGGFIY